MGLDALGAFRVDGLLESGPRAWASRLSPEQAEGAPARQGVERAPQAVSPLLFRLGGRDGGSGWAQTLASAGKGRHGQGAGSGSHSSSPGALSLFIWGCLRPAPGEGPLTPRTSGCGACSLHSSPRLLLPALPLGAVPTEQAVTALLPLPRALGGSLFLGHKAPLILCSAPSHVTRWAGRGSGVQRSRLSAAGVSPRSLFSGLAPLAPGAFRWCGCPLGPRGPWQWGPEPQAGRTLRVPGRGAAGAHSPRGDQIFGGGMEEKGFVWPQLSLCKYLAKEASGEAVLLWGVSGRGLPPGASLTSRGPGRKRELATAPRQSLRTAQQPV